uniref:Ribosomal protein L34 n=1 Tax=Ditylum brightwellii TaxID=49249 RepID=A0A6S8U694_9STRA|mmetsp:Transcript_6362/g.9644  ORF Transcript_6362/g.9644 Transcript_6362/m.9644 type:complete len:155 (+) Transcript_6362:73-537(+)
MSAIIGVGRHLRPLVATPTSSLRPSFHRLFFSTTSNKCSTADTENATHQPAAAVATPLSSFPWSSSNPIHDAYSPFDSTFNSGILSNLLLPPSIREVFDEVTSNTAVWLIKRTFQPSIIRKRRKTGFLKRKESANGRRVLRRRFNKGRARLGGC